MTEDELSSHLFKIRNEIGKCLNQNSNTGALEAAHRAVKLCEGQDGWRYAFALEQLATIFGRINEKADAVQCSKAALRATENALGENSPDTARVLLIVAEALFEVEASDEAEMCVSRALSLLADEDVGGYEQGTTRESIFFALDKYRWAEQTLGRLVERDALSKYLGRLSGLRRSAATAEGGCCNSLGEFWRNNAQPSTAIRYYEDALEALKKVSLLESHQAATVYSNLGLSRFDLKQRSEAIKLLELSLDIDEGVLSKSDGNTDTLELDRAIAVTSDNLSNMWSVMGDPVRARKASDKAIEFFRKHLDTYRNDYIVSLANGASLRSDSGSFDEALQLLEEASHMAQTNGLNLPPSTLPSILSELGRLRMLKGDLPGSKTALLEARELIAQRGLRDLDEDMKNRKILLDLLVRSGDAKEALAISVELADEELRRVRRELPLLPYDDAFVYERGFPYTVGNLVSLSSKLGDPVGITNAYRHLLARRGLVADAIRMREEFARNTSNDDLRSLHSNIIERKRTIYRTVIGGPGTFSEAAFFNKINELVAEHRTLEQQLAELTVSLGFKNDDEEIDPDIVASVLPKESVLLEFVAVPAFNLTDDSRIGIEERRAPRYYVFVLAAGKANGLCVVDLGPGQPIDNAIRAVCDILDKRQPTPVDAATLNDNIHRLSANLIRPLRDSLSNCSRLFVVPDGALSTLPFHVLELEPVEAGGSILLIDRFEICFLRAARELLRRFNTRDALARPAAVFGDPDLNASELEHRATYQMYDRLPGARDEAAFVAKVLGVTPIVGDRATKQRLTDLSSPSILHIAAHGIYLPKFLALDAPKSDEPDAPALMFNTDPTADLAFMVLPASGRYISKRRWLSETAPPYALLRSALLFAGAWTWLNEEVPPVEDGNGILTAAEAEMLDLCNTELAVLSACETGLGDVAALEGTLGLRRALWIAGARSVVVSLWKVPDAATRMLVEEFYTGLLRGCRVSEALRASQMTVRSKFSSIKSWAGFVVEGNPEAVFTGGKPLQQ